MKRDIFVCLFLFGVSHVLSEDRLIFVQAVWRHGDRSPTNTFKTDPYQEDSWPQGWGQLSATGMEQHFKLGEMLRKMYIDANPGQLNLSSSYKSDEVYVRSTDVNRTLISAISNMIGFYHNAPATQGVDYPNIVGWPTAYVPIAVHTVDFPTDHIGNPGAICPRRDQIWELVHETPEWKGFSAQNQELFANLSKITGWNVTLDRIGTIYSAIYIDGLYNKTDIYGNDSVYAQLLPYFGVINRTNDVRESWYVGLNLSSYEGTDFSVELPTLRGGSLLWAVIGNMRTKYDCLTGALKNTHICDNWMKNLKYYAWSFHDNTMSSLFATLGFKRSNYNEDGYPGYSSCLTFELWMNDVDNSTSIRAYYLPLANRADHLSENVTTSISGCENGCSLDEFEKRSQKYRPNGDGNIEAICNKNLSTPATDPTGTPNSASLIQAHVLVVTIALFSLLLS